MVPFGVSLAARSLVDQNVRDGGSYRRRYPRAKRHHLSLSPEIAIGIVKATDCCLVLLSSAGAFALYLGVAFHSAAEKERYFLTSLLAAILFVAGFQHIDGYTSRRLRMLHWQVTRTAATWAITIAVLLCVAFIGKLSETYSRGWTLIWVSTALLLMLIERGVVRLLMARWVRKGHLARNIAIVGANSYGKRLIAKLQNSRDAVKICGIFDDRKSRVPSICGCDVLGNTDDLVHFARQVPLDDVIIALPLTAEPRLQAIVGKLKMLPADLRLSAEVIAENVPIRGLSYLGDVPLIGIIDRPIKHWNAVAKWVEDKILAVLLLFAVAPVMAIIGLLIKLESRGPVLFAQERFGFNNDVIRIYKFRTMYADLCDNSGARRTVRNDPRVTRVGRVLRRLSLDELPQLLNVLKGEMSIVGPRPHATAMKAGDRLYGEAVEDYYRRHCVKPGMTGWAQVNGLRGEVDTLEKGRARVEYDLFYIEHWSLWLDLKTLALTVPALLLRQNAY
jgi:Undecaprenyl-phosphate glucose phosphotransferase